jgi:hypothetical protein
MVRRWALASVAGAAMAAPLLRADPVPVPAAQSPGQPEERAGLPLTGGARWSQRAVRLPEGSPSPVIDGRLDDDAWKLAEPITDFTQVEPVQGAPPTERIEARIVYTADALYIAIRCFDSAPEGILARQMRRDASLDADDRVSVSIDPFLTQRDGYYFELGPAGGKFDGLIENNREIRGDWDGIWDGRATIDDAGWSAEIRIPMKTIAFNPDNESWGLNIERVIQRKRETVRWATPTRSSSLSRIGDAGRVEGLTDLRQGIGLDVKPTLAYNIEADEGSSDLKPSLDMFYRITPNVTAVITLNTDFAEAEVDERQVNLTRFPLFFPEKRDFFLEDAGIFEFGGVQRSPKPYFSRRIGLVGGQPQDILAGMKITGRTDDWTFGLLDVQMKDDPVLGDKNLAVGRARYAISDEAGVGVIATNGDPATTGDNTVFGVDFDLLDPSINGGENALSANAFYMQSWTSGSDAPDGGDGASFGGRIEYPNDDWSFQLGGNQTDAGFNPALGFVSRRADREYFGNIRKRWRPTDSAIRRIDLSARFGLNTDLDNTTVSSDLQAPQLEIENNAGDRISAEYSPQRERLFEDFEIFEGVVLPPGAYDFDRYGVTASTSSNRPLAASLGVTLGDFYDGTRTDYETSLNWRPSSRINVELEYIQNDVDLPQGDFTTHIGRGRLDIAFSPSVSWSNLVQYDNVSESLGLNSRLRWIVQPGNDIFIVLNQGFQLDSQSTQEDTTDITIKVGWTFRF